MCSSNVLFVIALHLILYTFSPLLFISSHFCHLDIENNQINFYDEMTSLLDEGTAVSIVYLHFSMAFNTVSHEIFIGELMRCGQEEQTVR